MTETVTIEFNGQTFDLDIAKMNAVIDTLKGAKSSAERNMKNGKYLAVIDRILIDRQDFNDLLNDENRLNVIKELI
jgi:hypothetical protein